MGFFLAFEQSVWSFSGLFLALFGFLLKILSGKSAHKLSGCRIIMKNLRPVNLNFNQSWTQSVKTVLR